MTTIESFVWSKYELNINVISTFEQITFKVTIVNYYLYIEGHKK